MSSCDYAGCKVELDADFILVQETGRLGELQRAFCSLTCLGWWATGLSTAIADWAREPIEDERSPV